MANKKPPREVVKNHLEAWADKGKPLKRKRQEIVNALPELPDTTARDNIDKYVENSSRFKVKEGENPTTIVLVEEKEMEDEEQELVPSILLTDLAKLTMEEFVELIRDYR